jgi:hypothetical protein
LRADRSTCSEAALKWLEVPRAIVYTTAPEWRI